MKMRDLGEKPSKEAPIAGGPKEPKVWYQNLNISVKEVPELEDYELGDVIDWHIRTVVVSERKTTDRPKNIDLEMRQGAILNIKPLRKEAEELGLSMEGMRDLDKHRKTTKGKKKA